MKLEKRLIVLTLFLSIISSFSEAHNEGKKTNKIQLDPINVMIADDTVIYDENLLKSYVNTGSYSYLTKSDIATFRGSSVGDFLSGVPGVIVGNKRNSGALSLNIRGIANENRIPVYVDNGLQSVPSWQGYAGSSSRTYLDPDFISQIEIEKGPSLAADATGAIGGVVRINTLGWKDIISDDKNWGILLRLGTITNTISPPTRYTKGGYQTRYISECISNESGLCQVQTHSPNARYAHSPHLDLNSYNYSVAIANKWKNGDVVFAYAKRKQGNYFVGRHGQTPKIDKIKTEDDYVEINEEYEKIKSSTLYFKKNRSTLYRAGEEALNSSQNNRSYLAKANFYNEHHKFSLSYSRYQSKFGEIMSSILGFRANGALQGEGTEIKVDRYNVNYQYNPSTAYINLNLNAYYTKSDSSNFTPLIEEFGYSLSSRHAHFLISRQKGISFDNTSIIQINDRPLTLKYGVAHSYERIYQPRHAQARVRAKGYPENAIAPLYVRDGKRTETSSFININYSLMDWLKIDTGIRYFYSKTYDYVVREEKNYIKDKITKNAAGRVIYTPVYEKIVHQQAPITNKGFSPIVMLSTDIAKGTTVYAKYAQALRSPSLFQATKGWSMQNTSDNLEQLKPERAKNWEVGISGVYENIGKQDNILGIKLVYFNNAIDDYLTRSFDRNSGKTQTINLKKAKYEGVEFSAYYDMRKFYAKLSGSYYTKTRFCLTPEQRGDRDAQCYNGYVYGSNVNNTIPPKINLYLTLGSRWLDEKLEIGTRYSYYSKRITPVLSDTTSSIDWSPYTLIDLYANYDVSNHLRLTMTVDNLLNRYYLDINNMGLNTAPGRTLHLGLEYKF
ncbi:MAG: TonB-dependent receptor [[Pasteurella] mairii]|uniref:Heme acquisition system receptor n=1 Tax=[Pasteurella] mairii TaxID=757 RepID=A0A379B6A2_9PAST|nr:TonB-dependent receptor [[Pasteurella] mairii]SUB33798.1 heme acquisition system receptor [[Pasteurella] mairii]